MARATAGKSPLMALSGPVFVLAVVGGVGFWRVQMHTTEEQIEQKRKALKSLHLAGRVPPNQEVLKYLDQRTEALKQQYEAGLKGVALVPAAIDGHADAQLFFQERVHAVQTTLARLATARGMETPALLGLPKELPPVDVAPRFLLQLKMIEDAAELMMSVQEMSNLLSMKVEDPMPVSLTQDSKESFLTRLPVRVRFVSSLEALTKILGVLGHGKPLLDVQSVRIAGPGAQKDAGSKDAAGLPSAPLANKAPSKETGKEPAASSSSATEGPVATDLEVEVVLSRYLMTAPEFRQPEQEPESQPSSTRRKKPS